MDVVRPLRHRVLRSWQPFEKVVVPSDDLEGAVHLAAMDGDAVVGVMTLFAEAAPNADPHALRIRWMAVDAERQSQGIGAALLSAGVDVAGERGATTLWAHARDTALAFYRRHGFEPAAPSYIDQDTGLAHTVVVRRLSGGDA